MNYTKIPWINIIVVDENGQTFEGRPSIMAYKFIQQEIGPSHVDRVIHYPNASIADIIGNGFFIVDRQWKVSSWNNIAEKLLGISSNDIVGKNIWKQFKNAIPEGFYTAYHQALLEDIPVHFSIYWEEKNSWFDLTTCHFEDSLSFSFKSCYDRESPGQSTQQLKSIIEMYRLITKVTSDCLWEWNFVSEQVLWIDGGHKRAFGYPIENAVIPQRFWESRLHPDDKSRILTSMHTFFTNGMDVKWEEEYRFRKFNGEYAHVQDRGHLVYNGDNRTSLMIGATQDISAKKNAEVQLHKAETDLAQQLLENQKQIYAAILTAQEKDRNLIGAELHDNVNQILAATKLCLSAARDDPKSITEYLGQAICNIQNALDETRRISHELAAPDFEGVDLASMVSDLSSNMLETAGMDVYLNTIHLDDDLLNSELKLSAYRIAQEQFTNIVKYSHAKVVNILLSTSPVQFKMSIADDGVGMAQGSIINGIGLRNVKARVAVLNGEATINSSSNEGFVLEIMVPLGKSSGV